MNLPIRIIFMGTPDFAVPSLRALHADPQVEVVAVITQPDRQVGRKRVMTPPPVKVVAQELGLRIMQPEKVRTEASLAEIAALAPDVLVTAAYGQLLPQRLLDIPRVGCLNVHASLLPRWRGAAPIHRALMAGDEETGVTIMGMVLALDAGPVLTVRSTPIRVNDNVATLHERLATLGAEALLDVLPAYVMGSAASTAQNEEEVTYAERIRREDEFLDWTQTVQQVDWHVRGLTPWPGACTSLNDSLLKIWAGNFVEGLRDACEPATVRDFPGVGVCVRCADGWYQLQEVQPSGKRKMAASEWFRGISTDAVRFSEAAVKR